MEWLICGREGGGASLAVLKKKKFSLGLCDEMGSLFY